MNLEDDFKSMFVILDEKSQGFLTLTQISTFYKTLFNKFVDDELVSSVLQRVCSSKVCDSNHFQKVLTIIEEVRLRQENAYWDFLSFDTTGSCTISSSKALFLARNVLGKDFSLQSWENFMNSRNKDSLNAFSWDEFKHFMNVAAYKDSSEKEFVNESDFNQQYSSLANLEANEAIESYQFYQHSLESDAEYTSQMIKERQQYQENVKFEANRLVNRWNVGGVEAVIYDDGQEWEQAVVQSDEVSVTQLLSALEEKYGVLRDKLMWEMVKAQKGNENINKKFTNNELIDHFNDLQSHEKELRKSETLEHKIDLLYGHSLPYNLNVHVLMGETENIYNLEWINAQKRYNKYVNEGKSVKDINAIFENENLNQIKNSQTTSGQILIDLWKREKAEKQHLIEKLKANRNQSENLAIFAALFRQCERAKEGIKLEDEFGLTFSFEASASGVAVAERKLTFDPTKFSPENSRQQRLASERMKIAKRLKKFESHSKDKFEVLQDQNIGLVTSWMEVVKLLEKKHDDEREGMIYYLQHKNDKNKGIQDLNADEKLSRKQELSKFYEEVKTKTSKTENLKIQRKNDLQNILNEAVALYKDKLKAEQGIQKDSELCSVILGQLQTLQDVQFQSVVEQLRNMSAGDIYQLRKREYRLVRDQQFENIAELVLASESLTPQEQELLNAILAKYDVIRDRLYALKLDQEKFNSVEERNDTLQKMKDEGKTKTNETAQLQFWKRFKIAFSAKELFGPVYSRFCISALSLEESHNSIVIDEATYPAEDFNDFDILSALQRRYENESDSILKKIRESKNDITKQIEHEIVRQQWQVSLIKADNVFTSSCLNLGLFERKWIGNRSVRLNQDTNRFIRSAQERSGNDQPFNAVTQSEIKNLNISEPMTSLLSLQNEEWLRMRAIMKDVTSEELREAASHMSHDNRAKRLAEINTKRKTLDLKTEGGRDDLMSLLEEACALKHMARHDLLLYLSPDENTNDNDIIVSLLANLQEEQMLNGIAWLTELIKSGANESIATRMKLHMDSCENMFKVLCKYEGIADDEQLLKALDDKYDALKDKLLADALMRQLGEDEWKRLSERERQRRIMLMKLEERRLRKEGDFDALARLLGDAFNNDARLKGLLGLSREEYEKRLKERLAARNRGEKIDEDEISEDLGNGDASNPLLDLTSRFEEEREALMLMLNGQDQFFMDEKERQAALLRLRQSRLRAQEENRFDAAAIVSGLAERELLDEKRTRSDRARQRELARQRLFELKKRRSRRLFTITEEDEEIIREGDIAGLQDAVIKKLHLLHNFERCWLVQTLKEMQDPIPLVGTLSVQQISDKLMHLKTLVPQNSAISLDQHAESLSKAALYHEIDIALHSREVESKTKDELDISLLVELQSIQDKNEMTISQKVMEMGKADLIINQENLIREIKSGLSTNVPQTLLNISTEDRAENAEILDALQGKYDAVIDALASKVMPKKVGVAKWNAMSADEQNEKVLDLSSKVKELMNSGQFDEALALLTEGLSDAERDEIIALLLGSEEEKRKNAREEREKRRNERIKNGMSEEEADKLLQEEEREWEKEWEKRRRNVLEGLKMDWDKERDELLRSLGETNDRLEKERKRQAFLHKLRLQQRQLRRERDINAINLLLAMSKNVDDMNEKERQRQLDLAKERLDAFKRRKAAGITEEKDMEFNLDTDDVKVLADIVVREMESKHNAERTVLMEMMDSSSIAELRTKISSMSANDQHLRVRSLRDSRKQWRNEPPHVLLETKQEQAEILEEATAIQLTSLCSALQCSDEDAQANLLSSLQLEQAKETVFLLNGLLNKNAVTLKKMAEVERQARVDCWHDNVAGSLLGHSPGRMESNEEELEILEALEEKYDALKDKILAEALMKKLGAKEWANLSEQERQRRIVQIKQQEKRLRKEGKHDEVERIFNALQLSEKEIARLFGEQKASSEEAVKRRIERLKELKKERETAGLDANSATLEKLIEEEEIVEKKNRKNILLTLEHNLEQEREALLADLHRQGQIVNEERRRQLVVAKLRRQKRRIEAEEKYSAVELVFQSAKRDEAAMSATFEAEKSRQSALAKERLSVRMNQQQKKLALKNLTDPDTILKKINSLEAEECKDGSPTEKLLHYMESKQTDERETLIMLLLASDDQTTDSEISEMGDQELDISLKKFVKKRLSWREERLIRVISEDSDAKITEGQKLRLARKTAEQNKNLIRAFGYKFEIERRQTNTKASESKTFKNQIGTNWLAELQHTQENEMDTTTDLIADKSDEMLELLAQDQERARRECWNDNIGKVVFGLSLPGQDSLRPPSVSSSMDSEDKNLEEDVKEKMKEIQDLDQMLEEERNSLEEKKKLGEVVDIDKAMSDLHNQFDAKKLALNADLERQRAQIKEKLRRKQMSKDETEYEAHAAAAMVFLAEQRLKARKEKDSEKAKDQGSLVRQKLLAIKEKKRLQAEKEEKEKKEAENEEKKDVIETPKAVPPMPQLLREKTVITKNISNEEKLDIFDNIMRSSKMFQTSIEAQKQAQKLKLEKKRKELEQARLKKDSEATKIFQKFQEDENKVRDIQNLNLERQKTMVGDRLSRLKTEKTMTMRQKAKKGADFDKLADKESTNLNEDDKMKMIAEKLQRKFEEEYRKEELELKEKKELDKTESLPKENLEKEVSAPSKKLDAEDKKNKMKEKMLKMKQQKAQEASSNHEAQQE